MGNDLTKVHIDLPNHWATGGESIWARALGENRFQIDNVPFYAYDLNHEDIVEAVPSAPNLKPSVLRVLQRSGHRTLRVFFAETIPEDECVNQLESLNSLHVTYERSTARYVALDLAPSSEMTKVRTRLDEWQAAGIAEYETCEARVPGSFDDVPQPDNSRAAG